MDPDAFCACLEKAKKQEPPSQIGEGCGQTEDSSSDNDDEQYDQEEEENSSEAESCQSSCESSTPSDTKETEDSVENVCPGVQIENPSSKPYAAATPPLSMLPPDHPILEAFQASLKAQLLRAKEQVMKDIRNIKNDIREANDEFAEVGARLYSKQRYIELQNTQLEEYASELQLISEERQEIEAEVKHLQAEHDARMKLEKQKQKQYKDSMLDLDNIQKMYDTLRKLSYELEEEVKSAQGIVSRDGQMQRKYSEEKKQADILFYHLDREVKNRELELADVEAEIEDQGKVINVLNQSISDANADLTELQDQHKLLTRAWNEVIIAISHRDKIMNDINEQRNKKKEFIKLCLANIKAIQKLISTSSTEQEKLKKFEQRLKGDYDSLERQYLAEEANLLKIVEKLQQVPMLIRLEEDHLKTANRECVALQNNLRRLERKTDLQNKQKYEIEQKMMKAVEDTATADKASKYRMKMLREMQEQRRKMQMGFVQTENSYSTVVLKIERYKTKLIQTQKESNALNTLLTEAEKRYDEVQDEVKKVMEDLAAKMKLIEKYSGQLADAATKADSDSVGSIHYQIQLLEAAVDKCEREVASQQYFWMGLQNHYVILSNKRNQQSMEIQRNKQQLLLARQKAKNMDIEIGKITQQSKKKRNEIERSKKKIICLNAKYSAKVKNKSKSELQCEHRHQEVMEELKDREMQVVRVEEELCNMQTDIEHFKMLALEKHREALSWETKFKLVDESVRWRKGELAVDSEISQIKGDIVRIQHRMGQLKTKERLLMDEMKRALKDREKVFEATFLRSTQGKKSKNQQAGPKTKSKLQRKADEVREKTKRMQAEMNKLNAQDLPRVNGLHEELRDVVMKLSNSIDDKTDEKKVMINLVEDNALRKKFQFQLLLRKQNRVKAYRKLTQSICAPKATRSREILEKKLAKQLEIQKQLLKIVKDTMQDHTKSGYMVDVLHLLTE